MGRLGAFSSPVGEISESRHSDSLRQKIKEVIISRFDVVDLTQVPVLLRVVQTVSDDKGVWNLKTDIINRR